MLILNNFSTVLYLIKEVILISSFCNPRQKLVIVKNTSYIE